MRLDSWIKDSKQHRRMKQSITEHLSTAPCLPGWPLYRASPSMSPVYAACGSENTFRTRAPIGSRGAVKSGAVRPVLRFTVVYRLPAL